MPRRKRAAYHHEDGGTRGAEHKDGNHLRLIAGLIRALNIGRHNRIREGKHKEQRAYTSYVQGSRLARKDMYSPANPKNT